MFIVNAGIGFRNFLWPAAQKLVDPMTIAKIQVMIIALVFKYIFSYLLSAAAYVLVLLRFWSQGPCQSYLKQLIPGYCVIGHLISFCFY